MTGLKEFSTVSECSTTTAADLIKAAMIEIDARLHERGLSSRMILQVHDELVFDVPENELDEMREMARQKMEGVFKLKVPIKVDIKTGDNWLEA